MNLAEIGDEESREVAQRQTTGIEQKKAEAVSQIQASHVMAKRFPRDEFESERRMLEACKRYSLAEQAVYAFPRGGQRVSGPSIRLAETLARSWGNLRYGFQELEQLEGRSTVEAFCHDLESNTLVSRTFTVHHKIALKDGKEKILRDPRDIYEIVANNAQRRVRAAILEILPGDVVEKAVKACQKTLALGEKAEPLIDRLKRMVAAFAELSISREMLEKRLEHPIDATTPEEIAEYTQIFNSLRDGMSKRSDWFSFAEPDTGKAAELSEKIKARANKSAEPKSEPAVTGSFETFNDVTLPKGKSE